MIQLDESKKERGERVEDGTFQRDRALYEVFFFLSILHCRFFYSFNPFAVE